MSSKLKIAIDLINSGQALPVVALTRENPHQAAAYSKNVTSKDKTHQNYDNRGNRTIDANAVAGFNQVSREVAQRTKDFRAMMALFPETELAAQILVSCVISPRDMTKGEVNIIVANSLKSEKLTALMLEVVKEYFAKTYKIKPLLPKILRNVLIEQGSDPHIVLPENTIDDLINGSASIKFEHISHHLDPKHGTFRHFGFLGNPVEGKTIVDQTKYISERWNDKSTINYNPKVVFDKEKPGFLLNKNLVVVDNPDVLRLPQIIDRKNREKAANVLDDQKSTKAKNLYQTYATEGYGYNTENFDQGNKNRQFNDRELMALLYKNKHVGMKPIVKAKPDDELARMTIGAPLVMRVPAEAVIPVYTPGNEEQHIGYFLLLDADGNPLTMNSNNQYITEMATNLNASNDMNSYMLNRGTSAILGNNCKHVNTAQATRIYSDIVEADLLARARNGVLGRQVSLVKNEEVYRLMLARQLANQMTQVLYIPMELMTYFAYRYDERGIGVSMLDGTRHINMMRSVLMISTMMNQVKNAIGRTTVEVNLDEEDSDPDATMEQVVHEFMRLRQSNFPSGINSPADIADWVSKAGFTFVPKGHPGLPQMEIVISENQSNLPEGNQTMEDELRKRAIMSLGIPPEAVDNGFAGDFATSVVANNLLLAKRVMDIQEVMVPQLTDHMRKVARADGNLLEQLKKTVRDNYEDLFTDIQENDEFVRFRDQKETVVQLIVSELLSNFEASLPQPDSGTIENLKAAFDAYMESVDAVIPHYIATEIAPETFVGDGAVKAEDLKNMFRSKLARDWMIDNSFVPEVTTMFDKMMDMGGEGDKELKDHLHHLHNISRLVVRIAKGTRAVVQAANTDLLQINGGEPMDNGMGGGMGGGDMGGGGDSFGDGGSSGDPFGGGGMPDFDNAPDPLAEDGEGDDKKTPDNLDELADGQPGSKVDENAPGDLPSLGSVN